MAQDGAEQSSGSKPSLTPRKGKNVSGTPAIVPLSSVILNMSSVINKAVNTPPLWGRPGEASSPVIIGNGEFPSSPELWKLIDEAPLKVCLDGAADRFVATGRTPDLIIGDGDSISAALKERFADRLIVLDEQENNDQTKAVLQLKERGVRNIAILAATGQREDHTIGNVSLLIDYLRLGITARILTDYGTFVPVSASQTFTCPKGTQISIFNFTAKGLTAEGLRYPLRDFTSWWQGTLNETTEEAFTICGEGEFLVYIARA